VSVADSPSDNGSENWQAEEVRHSIGRNLPRHRILRAGGVALDQGTLAAALSRRLAS